MGLNRLKGGWEEYCAVTKLTEFLLSLDTV
jgi:hypothetical protein